MSTQIQLLPDVRALEVARYERVALHRLPPDSELVGADPSPSFIQSVRVFGITTPLLLIEQEGSDALKIAEGRRRTKAARKCDDAEAPAMIFPSSWTVQDVLALMANSQRSENPASDLRAIKNLLAAGSSEAEICEATGLPKATLEKRMRLVNLDDELLAAYEMGKMRASTAEAAARLRPERQAELVKLLRENGRIRGKDVKALMRVATEEAVAALPLEMFETPQQTFSDEDEHGEDDDVENRPSDYQEFQARVARELSIWQQRIKGADPKYVVPFENWPALMHALVYVAKTIVPEDEKGIRGAINDVAILVQGYEFKQQQKQQQQVEPPSEEKALVFIEDKRIFDQITETYCADTIGQQNKTRGVYQYGGRNYVCVSHGDMATGGEDAECYQVVAKGEYSGESYTYTESRSSGKRGYEGMVVKCGKRSCVLTNPITFVFEPHPANGAEHAEEQLETE